MKHRASDSPFRIHFLYQVKIALKGEIYWILIV